jgi:hypothetical protein
MFDDDRTTVQEALSPLDQAAAPAKAAVLAELTRDVPLPSLDDIVTMQKELGLR